MCYISVSVSPPHTRPMIDISNRSPNFLCEHRQNCIKIQADLLQMIDGVKDKTGLSLSSVGDSSLISWVLANGKSIVV